MAMFNRKTKDTKDSVEKQPKVSATTSKDTTQKTAVTSKRAWASSIILEPVVTEKAAVTGSYYFKVATYTNRNEVKKAFQIIYGKAPVKVNIINVIGKKVRFGNKFGKRSDWKKAIVYLPAGESIDMFISE